MNSNKLSILPGLLLLVVCLASCQPAGAPSPASDMDRSRPLSEDVIYHVFLRSFYDSNADGHGDLEGLRLKLDYLQDLGVTAILITPLYDSDLYHNYFPNDFEKIDPEFGNLENYLKLVADVHRQDVEPRQGGLAQPLGQALGVVVAAHALTPKP